ncbi:MAG: hypothetical protein WC460_01595 [Patescibacteria group bacterium]
MDLRDKLGIVCIFLMVLAFGLAGFLHVYEKKVLPEVKDAKQYFENYKQKNPVPKNCNAEGPIDTNDWEQKAKVYTYVYQCEKGITPDGRLKELEIKYLFVVCSSQGSNLKLDIIPRFENHLDLVPTKDNVVCGSKGPI